MVKKKFGRIVNIASGLGEVPLVGLDLSSGARARLTFLAGVARRSRSTTSPSTHAAGAVRHRPAAQQRRGAPRSAASATSRSPRSGSRPSARRLGLPDEFGATCAFPLGACHYITGQNILLTAASSGARSTAVKNNEAGGPPSRFKIAALLLGDQRGLYRRRAELIAQLYRRDIGCAPGRVPM